MTKTTFAHGQLRSIVERIERLEEEKKTISGDIAEVYSEAKASGFDVKILRKLIALRKKETAEREEEESVLAVYMVALGMQPDLFDEAEDRQAVKDQATRHRMEDLANVAQEMADAGLTSPEAAEETKRLAQAVNDKFGDGKPLQTART